MRPAETRRIRTDARWELNNLGFTSRELSNIKGIGSAARILLGEGVQAKIVNFERQPGPNHKPQAWLQEVEYHEQAYDLKYRPTNIVSSISLIEARQLVSDAFTQGQLRAGELAMKTVQLFTVT